jgi:polysaccharide biosynthesis protein PslH
MNILYVTYGLPYPPHAGGSVRDFLLLDHLANSHHIVLLCLTEEPVSDTALAELERRKIHTHVFPLHVDPQWNKLAALTRHLCARRPLATLPFYSESLARCIRDQIQTREFDVIQIEHSFLAPYVDAVPRAFKGRKILTFHNIGVEQYRRIAMLNLGWQHRSLSWLKWRMMIGWESSYAERFDRVVVMSERDGAWLRQVNPKLNISVIGHGVDSCAIKPLAESESSHSILFVGTMGYPPNVDAMLWFCRDIFPRIARRVPDIHLTIAGRAPRIAVQKLARSNITVTGRVDDLQPYYQRAQVVIVPLRAGGGTRVKILEAMAYGRAIVSTTLGAEGLMVNNGVDILIADEPEKFAEGVIALLQDSSRRKTMACNARRLVESRYDWTELGNDLIKAYNNDS